MSISWDLAAYDRENHLVLVVEAKTKLDAPPAWAARLRRNLLAHGTAPSAPYFLLALPDRFYLWKEPTAELAEPTYTIDARPILQPYFDQAGTTAATISGQSLELIVTAWLNELMQTPAGRMLDTPAWLGDSGLAHAVAGGRLANEVPA